MSNSYTESSKKVIETVINEMEISQFVSGNIPDSEYSYVPLDHNFLKVRTVKWIPDGTNNSISLGSTLSSKEQILYVLGISAATSILGSVVLPDVYQLNDARNSLVFSFIPPADGTIFFIKIIDGLFFSGVQGGSSNV